MSERNKDQHRKQINQLYNLLSTAQAKGMHLYTITYVFNYLKDFRIAGEGERLAEERVLFWWKGVLKRLYARPWQEGMFGFVFLDYGDTKINNPHAHCLLAINDKRYRQKYEGLKFNECFKGKEYRRWLLPSRADQPDLLKRYWVGAWDGESKLLSYCMKRYEFGEVFFGSTPIFINGNLCIPESIRRKQKLREGPS